MWKSFRQTPKSGFLLRMFSQTKPFAANEKCKRRLVQGQVNMFGWVEETNRVPKFVLCYPCRIRCHWGKQYISLCQVQCSFRRNYYRQVESAGLINGHLRHTLFYKHSSRIIPQSFHREQSIFFHGVHLLSLVLNLTKSLIFNLPVSCVRLLKIYC